LKAKKQKELILRKESLENNFWEDRLLAERKLADLSILQKEITLFSSWEQSLNDAAELYQLAMATNDSKMIEALNKNLQDLEDGLNRKKIELYFSGPYDKANAILSIYAGAGGNDAEDWARMLKEMYYSYLTNKNFKISVLEEHLNDYKGIKQISLEIVGAYAFGTLKKEKGVHRLVRISPFSAAKLRHTSFAYVEVLPVLQSEDLVLNPADLEIDLFRASGPGGQNVQKVESAVRITHKPTGLVVVSQSQRTQSDNKEKAMELLRAKLFSLQEAQHAKIWQI